MRNLIPQTNSVDPLSQDLRAQFESIQRLISQQQQNQKMEHTETDDETLDDTLDSSSDETVTQMALSTAIAAQREIDCLLNGISELENMLSEEDATFQSSSDEPIRPHPVRINNNNIDENQNAFIVKNDLNGRQTRKSIGKKKSSIVK
jgi:hypothetical protein|eukprot:99576_1